jgi:hypothetical protein
MKNLRLLGVPKLKQPIISNYTQNKKTSPVPLIQKPKKTTTHTNPLSNNKSKLIKVSITNPKRSPSNKSIIKLENSKDNNNLMLSTNLPASAFTQTYTNASPIKLKKNIFPNDKDKYYHSQQTTYKKITKPISIQTFPISKMKSLHSYTNTASSTVNSEYNSVAFHNNNNNKNGIKEGDGTASSSSFGKVGILKDNASFNNILCYINSLMNPKYCEKDLRKNKELIEKLDVLESKNNVIEQNMKLLQRNKEVNIINADMINRNQIVFESEQRKEIYRNYFNFYFDICKDIEVLAKVLEKQSNVNEGIIKKKKININEDNNNNINFNNNNNNNRLVNELKKIDEVNSKLSSLHSVINFSKSESQLNNNTINNNNNINKPKNTKTTKPPISPSSYNSNNNINNIINTNNINNSIKSNNTQTLLISSSLGSEINQKLIEESFKKEITNFFSIDDNDHKLTKKQHIIIDNNNNNEYNISIDSSATIKGEFHATTTNTKINVFNGHNRSKTDLAAKTNNNNILIRNSHHSCNSSSSDIIYNDDSDSSIIERDDSEGMYYQIPTHIPVVGPGVRLNSTPLKKDSTVKAATQMTPSPTPKLIKAKQTENKNCVVF